MQRVISALRKMANLFRALAAALASGNAELPPVEYLEHAALNAENDRWNHQSEDDTYATAWADYTGSMKPHLKGGETLLMEKYRVGKQPKIGDLVVIKTDNGRLVHRLAQFGPGWIKTKGIANEHDDGKWPTDRLQYVVRRVLAQKPNEVAAKLVEPEAPQP